MKRKQKHFYSHIVETDTLIFELNKLDLSQSEKYHLIELIDSNLHHAILEEILTHLDDEEKIIFLEHIAEGKYNDIWQLLEKRIDGVESKIEMIAEEVRKELQEDIDEIKK